MRLRIAVLTAAALSAAAAPAAAAELTITTSGRSFSPAQATVVTGDTVTWRNTDRVAHNVTGSEIKSGNLVPGAVFARRMQAPGSHPYVCTLHPSMSGQVEVVGALLEGPQGGVLAGTAVGLTGRVPAGTSTVTIERLQAGSGVPVVTTRPAADGSFSAAVIPTETSSYRAVAGTAASAPVELRVVTGMAVGLDVHRGKRFDRVVASVRPAPHGDYTAVLELYSRERFSWRRAGHRTLDANGRASFRLTTRLRRRARVVLLSAAGAEVAVSQSVRLWREGGVTPSKPSRRAGPDSPGEEPHHH